MGGSCSTQRQSKIATENNSSSSLPVNRIAQPPKDTSESGSEGGPLILKPITEYPISRRDNDSISYLNDFVNLGHLIRLKDWRNTPNISSGLLPLHAALLNADDNTVKRFIEEGAHNGFRLPEDGMLAERIKKAIIKSNLQNLIIIPEESQFIVSMDKSMQRYDIHDAAKVGNEQGLLELLIQKSDPWLRDDFDNLALYYCSLRGHLRCAAWLLLAMGGLSAIPSSELDRCKVNALTNDMKLLFKGNKKASGMYNKINNMLMFMYVMKCLCETDIIRAKIQDSSAPTAGFTVLENDTVTGNLFNVANADY